MTTSSTLRSGIRQATGALATEARTSSRAVDATSPTCEEEEMADCHTHARETLYTNICETKTMSNSLMMHGSESMT